MVIRQDGHRKESAAFTERMHPKNLFLNEQHDLHKPHAHTKLHCRSTCSTLSRTQAHSRDTLLSSSLQTVDHCVASVTPPSQCNRTPQRCCLSPSSQNPLVKRIITRKQAFCKYAAIPPLTDVTTIKNKRHGRQNSPQNCHPCSTSRTNIRKNNVHSCNASRLTSVRSALCTSAYKSDASVRLALDC